MKNKAYVWTLLLCVLIGLVLLVFNAINWLTYLVVVLIVGILTQFEKRRSDNDRK